MGAKVADTRVAILRSVSTFDFVLFSTAGAGAGVGEVSVDDK